MSRFAVWTPARGCSAGPTKGAKALMAWSLDTFDDKGARSDGIFNCRNVRGASTYSAHAEGRALDVGFPLVQGKASPACAELVELLLLDPYVLGICCIIFNRRIWSAKSPDADGRPYTGVDPHIGHAHVELTPRAANVLNLATIRRYLDDEVATSQPAPASTGNTTKPVKKKQYGRIEWGPYNAKAKPGVRHLERGDRGDDVKFVQKYIGEKRAGKPDGFYGDRTVQAVRWYQTMRDIKVTGEVGKPTWNELLAA